MTTDAISNLLCIHLPGGEGAAGGVPQEVLVQGEDVLDDSGLQLARKDRCHASDPWSSFLGNPIHVVLVKSRPQVPDEPFPFKKRDHGSPPSRWGIIEPVDGRFNNDQRVGAEVEPSTGLGKERPTLSEEPVTLTDHRRRTCDAS